MTGSPALQIVVIAYGAPDLLRLTLTRISGRLPVVVVDNSSDPGVAAVAAACGAEYLDPGRNLGFGTAVNVVLKRLAGGPPTDVLLLNPDAELDEAGALRLQQVMHEPRNDLVGALSARLTDQDGTPQRESWPFPTPGRAWLEAAGLSRWNTSRDFVVGAVLLLRWEALSDVGLFDERFFLYAEETDWQRRAAAAGWRSDVCAEVTATHVGGATSTRADLREALFHAGSETYVRKWFGASGWWRYRAALVLGSAARGLVLPGARGVEARHRARLYLRGPRRVAGLAKA